jgi:signal transduction histidine kinase
MLHDPNEQKLFPTLPDKILDALRPHGQELALNDGDVLFSEGQTEYPFFAVLAGKIKVTKHIGGEEQLLAVHSRGQFTGEISMLSGGPAIATGRAVGQARVLKIEISEFRRVVTECGEMGRIVLASMALRATEVDGFLRQQEKLAALGKMAAGLAHELNNPASAARRAAGYLREAIEKVQRISLDHDGRFSERERDGLLALERRLIEERAGVTLDAIERSDQEEEIQAWLESHKIAKAWDIAPTLVAGGLRAEHLDHLAECAGDALEGALVWLEATLRMADLTAEVEAAMTRISDLVGAMKEYSYMDQAAFQEIDIHKGLESTLKIFTPRLKSGSITVVRDYDRTLPKVCAYVGELNQVWTNLIDNALDAMNGRGTLTIRTRAAEDGVSVEVIDSGPGIPSEIQSRIFEPFFTTKPVGQGTGLGLEISYRIITVRHHGSIRVNSKPGETRFRILLPLAPPKEETWLKQE